MSYWRGFGDVNQDAVNLYASAGAPASCATYQTVNQGANLIQSQCQVAGSGNWHDASLVQYFSPAQLAAELAGERAARTAGGFDVSVPALFSNPDTWRSTPIVSTPTNVPLRAAPVLPGPSLTTPASTTGATPNYAAAATPTQAAQNAAPRIFGRSPLIWPGELAQKVLGEKWIPNGDMFPSIPLLLASGIGWFAVWRAVRSL